MQAMHCPISQTPLLVVGNHTLACHARHGVIVERGAVDTAGASTSAAVLDVG